MKSPIGGRMYVYAAPDDWLMIRPYLFFTISGAHARAMSQAPCRFTEYTFWRYS